MRRFLFILLAPSLLLLGGCKRGVCDFADDGFDPMSAEWQAHKDLIPPSAKVCGHL